MIYYYLILFLLFLEFLGYYCIKLIVVELLVFFSV